MSCANNFASLDAVEFKKYEKCFLEQGYWKIVMQVVEGTSVQPSETEASEERALEEPRRKVARLVSVVGNAVNAGATVRGTLCPIDVPGPAVVGSDDHVAEAVNLVNVVRQYSPPHCSIGGTALKFGSACAALSGELSGFRWTYECYLVSADLYCHRVGRKREVAIILTWDHTGPLLVRVRSPALGVLKISAYEHNCKDGELKLRFDHLCFMPLEKNDWNGTAVTPIRMGHTLTHQKQSCRQKQKVDASEASVSACHGTRLSMIRVATSPYMRSGLNFCTPKPPLVVVSYSLSLSHAVSPFRVSIAGTVQDLEETQLTYRGDLRRNFKPADDAGKWVSCVTHGRHAESDALESMRYIVACFCPGRPALGKISPQLWLFKDAFILPLERRVVAPLLEPVLWQ